jgi:uncharacterized protein YggE
MNKNMFAASAILAIGCLSSASAQTVQVDQQNRTIEIAATSSVHVTADRVTITVGYRNYGPTHDAAFADNSKTAAQILKAWKDAGLSEKEIATNALTSRITSESELRDLPSADRKLKEFAVDQSWKITQKIDVAEKLLDIAVDAGANYVGSPDWELTDPDAAETLAYASALEKARVLADQVAKSFGAKTGTLLYASNEARPAQFTSYGVGGGVGGGVFLAGKDSTARPDTKLLPQKIEKSGYVRAIFALE